MINDTFSLSVWLKNTLKNLRDKHGRSTRQTNQKA